jgi:DNA-binding FadR family transcriptional regulator
MPLETTQRRGLVGQTIEQLSRLIESGEWEVGERIPAEADLAAALGVGRNTVREAVRALAHLGVLDVRHGAGTFVVSTSSVSGPVRRLLADSEVRHVTEVRRALEVEAARLATQRRTRADLTRLSKALERRDAAWDRNDAAGWAADDAAFHALLVAASHNPLLVQLYDDVAGAVEESLARWSGPDLAQAEWVDHRPIVTALTARDADAAVRAAGAHLDDRLRW